MGLATVCGDLDVAAMLVRHGARVVLCSPDPVAVADRIVVLRDAAADAGGRVAALIGDLLDPAVEAAAVAMAAELFGGEPVVVRSLSEAHQQLAKSPGCDGLRSGTVSIPAPVPPVFP